MMSRVFSACPMGVGAVPIIVETDVRQNKLVVNIVGLPDAATRESKDRLIPAITNSGFALEAEEIVINLPLTLTGTGPLGRDANIITGTGASSIIQIFSWASPQICMTF